MALLQNEATGFDVLVSEYKRGDLRLCRGLWILGLICLPSFVYLDSF